MASEKTKLVNKIFQARSVLQYERRNYQAAVAEYKQLCGRWENQTADTKVQFRNQNPSLNELQLKEIWDMSRPVTIVSKKDLRKEMERNISFLKQHFKMAQHAYDEAVQNLEKYEWNKHYWFVATVREEKHRYPEGTKNLLTGEDAGGREYTLHPSRCWGFYADKDLAILRVTQNATDMNEAGYYRWAVIEPHCQGLCQVEHSSENIWFEAEYREYEKNGKTYKECIGYKRCAEPEFAKQTVGWAIS